jgi:acylphosphatase
VNGTANDACLLRVRGRVQGVGYRYACVGQARALGIAGWVRNRADGSVELMLLGAPQALQQMRAWLRHGVPAAHVDAIDEAPAPDGARSTGFEQRPTV